MKTRHCMRTNFAQTQVWPRLCCHNTQTHVHYAPDHQYALFFSSIWFCLRVIPMLLLLPLLLLPIIMSSSSTPSSTALLRLHATREYRVRVCCDRVHSFWSVPLRYVIYGQPDNHVNANACARPTEWTKRIMFLLGFLYVCACSVRICCGSINGHRRRNRCSIDDRGGTNATSVSMWTRYARAFNPRANERSLIQRSCADYCCRQTTALADDASAATRQRPTISISATSATAAASALDSCEIAKVHTGGCSPHIDGFNLLCVCQYTLRFTRNILRILLSMH